MLGNPAAVRKIVDTAATTSSRAYRTWSTTSATTATNTTWAVCVLDTRAALQDSTLGLFNSAATRRAAKARSRRKGFVSGEERASMFAWLRANDLILERLGQQHLLGNKPPAFDILAWNADITRLPGQFHGDLLDLV